MDLTENTVVDLPQAMDVSESGVHKPVSGGLNLKLRKGRPMKRSQNVRKTKAMAKAICKSEQSAEKIMKNQSKTTRIQSAKTLLSLFLLPKVNLPITLHLLVDSFSFTTVPAKLKGRVLPQGHRL
ncbi:uncharacterized protein LOC111012789 [Momordica charantia]|uniref:Uncharacterized protein LOC111012789 n=1 Tax=Momordica charantia TaxID=3673 RepID=A0A6J1CP23_MOMCH|nr:uncharacterized protein LOC111012789 [Momordica charantia]